MKKVTYLIVLMFSLVLLSASCEKDEPVVKQTLEEQYPDWSNLTWVSTDGKTAETKPDVYPRLNITINGDNGTIRQTMDGDGWYYNEQFSTITIESNTITFTGHYAVYISRTGTFEKNGTQITLVTKGMIKDSHTYVLQIN